MLTHILQESTSTEDMEAEFSWGSIMRPACKDRNIGTKGVAKLLQW